MHLYSQLDLRWAGAKIGKSNLTVGRWGCALTSLINGANCLGANKGQETPGSLARNVACFTDAKYPGGAGLILWAEAAKRLGLRFIDRKSGRSDLKIREALKDPKCFALLQVNDGAHWVLAWRKTLIGDSYVVFDPLGGVKVDVIKKYKNITAMAFFAMK